MAWPRTGWLAVLLLLAAVPAAQAATCTDVDPCEVHVRVTAAGLLAPAQIDSLGPLVLVVEEAAGNATEVSFASVLVAVPANGTNTSAAFTLPAEGRYLLTESTHGHGAEILVRLPPASVAVGGDPPAPGPARVLAIALPVLVGLALFAIAAIVVRYGGKQRHNRLFAALFFASGVKSVSEGLSIAAPTTADAWALLGQLCALVMLPLLFLFVASFPRPTRWMTHRPALGILAFVPSFLMLALLLVSTDDVLIEVAALGFNVLSSGLTFIALILLLRTRARSPDHIERKQATFVTLGFVPSFAATWAITGLILGAAVGAVSIAVAVDAINIVLRYVSPVLEFIACGLVAFAILKYNILGVSPKFRVGVKNVLVGSLFAFVFLLTQFIENVILQGKLFAFAGDYGSFIFSGVAGLVLFKPIESMSNKVAERILPARPEPGAGVSTRAEEVYHAQCTYVLRDAQVSEREMAFLRNLRDQLGLTAAQAQAIEERVERLLKVDAPQTGASAAPPTSEGPADPATVPPGPGGGTAPSAPAAQQQEP